MPIDVIRYQRDDALIDDYILAHIDPEPEYLQRVERLTNLRLTYPQMCSGHLQGRILKMLCGLTGARRVLELGTFSGYSALAMAEAGAEVFTIEAFDEMEDFLREVFAASPYASQIHLTMGDALTVLADTRRSPLRDVIVGPKFDLCFIDADKRRYVDFYQAVLPVMRQGGLIVVDNTLWDGKVVQPVKDSDLQTQGVMAFNDLAARDERVETVILPLRDGLTLLRVK